MTDFRTEMQKVCGYIKRDLKLDYDVHFFYGTLNEFVTLLNSAGSDKARYPFLFINSIGTTEDIDNVNISDIIIATLSSSSMSAQARDQKTFNPILKPIYEEFRNQLWYNRYYSIKEVGRISTNYFYGEEGRTGYESLKFPDFVDALSIKNIKLIKK